MERWSEREEERGREREGRERGLEIEGGEGEREE